MYVFYNILAFIIGLTIIFISVLFIVGIEGLKRFKIFINNLNFKHILKILINNLNFKHILKIPFKPILKISFKPILEILNQFSETFKYGVYGCACFLLILFILLAYYHALAETQVLSYKTLIIASRTIILTLLVCYLCLVLFSIIIKHSIIFLFDFTGKYKEKIMEIALITNMFSLCLLGFSIKFPMNIYPGIVCMLLAAICLHILSLYGMILIIKSGNPFKKNKDKTTHNILIGMLVWLFIILAPIYMEVILCVKYTNDAFILSGSHNQVTGLWDLLYFTIVTFATVGFCDIIPNHPISKGVTMGIFITSIIYLILFIGTAITQLTGRKPLNSPPRRVRGD